jgi:flavin reductase (DIM6/NTAB) family NADH-FMN oxidoreductase RutF
MKHIDIETINKMERFYRANLINSITGLKQANLIGSVSSNGIANVAIFSSVIHLGANPALLAFIQRPITETSHTYKNILDNNFFTINQVNENIVQQSHFTSAKYEDGISEFETCTLTPQFLPQFIAPFVQESSVKIGLQLVEIIPITHNNTKMIIGEIKHILINENLIEQDGNVNLEIAKAITVAGLETYYKSTIQQKLPYAKVEENPFFNNGKTN